jgi:hypothetical protein
MRIGPADAVHRPDLGRGDLSHLDARLDLAVPRAQIVAEPGDDEADALDGRGHGLQPVERHDDVGLIRQRVQVLGRGGAAAAALRMASVA